jgi:hypothetical protein
MLPVVGHERHRDRMHRHDQVEALVLVLLAQKRHDGGLVVVLRDPRDIEVLRVVVDCATEAAFQESGELPVTKHRELRVTPVRVEDQHLRLIVRGARRNYAGKTEGRHEEAANSVTPDRRLDPGQKSTSPVSLMKRGDRMLNGCSHVPPGTNVLL